MDLQTFTNNKIKYLISKDFKILFSRTFKDKFQKTEGFQDFPGLPRTKLKFQDFPGQWAPWNIGRLTFLRQFSRLEIHKKSTKIAGFQCAVTEVVLVKNSWIKGKYKLNLYFTLKIINIDNRSCRKLPSPP